VLWYGARLALPDSQCGVLIVFSSTSQDVQAMRDLSKMADTVSKAMVGYERIRKCSTSRASSGRAGRPQGSDVHRRIEFNRSASATSRQTDPRGRQPHDEAGQVAAIVGPSGAGRPPSEPDTAFYDPVSGQVVIQGTDIAVPMKTLRDQMSFVLQDTLLFARRSGKHRIRQAWRVATESGARRTGERARVHRCNAEATTRGRRARRHALGRSTPAHRDCPCHHPQHAHSHPDEPTAVWMRSPSKPSWKPWTG